MAGERDTEDRSESVQEADLVAVSKTGYVTEVEIKVSGSDWLRDRRKPKWATRNGPNFHLEPPDPGVPTRFERDERVKYFWYAAPLELARNWEEFEIPAYAGVVGIGEPEAIPGRPWPLQVLRRARPIPPFRELTDKEKFELARLGTLRFWDLRASRRRQILQEQKP
jgi:hypothetical protein